MIIQRGISANIPDFSENRLENVINDLISEIDKQQVKTDGKYPFDYIINQSKEVDKKFVARQSPHTEKWRKKMKNLLTKYLNLKFSEGEEKVKDKSAKLKRGINFKIKIDNYPLWYTLDMKHNTLSFQKTEGKKVVSLSIYELYVFRTEILTRIFKGSHLEIVDRRKCDAKQNFFWSDWKIIKREEQPHWAFQYLPVVGQQIVNYLGGWFYPSSPLLTPAWDDYKTIVHPLLKQVALRILNTCSVSIPKVVEICGGGGELAVQIVKEYPNVEYFLLEKNKESLREAEANIAAISSKKIIPIKTDVTNPNDYFIDVEKQHPMKEDSINLIIGSGALTQAVLENHKIAMDVARKCHTLLRLNGKMILAGHSYCLLERTNFESLGFRVINTFIPGSLYSDFSKIGVSMFPIGDFNKQLYILEKSDLLN